MSISNFIALFTLLLSTYACDNNMPESLRPSLEPTMIKLMPLSPYQYEFTTNDGENVINYFFTEHKNWQNKAFRKELKKQLEAIQLQATQNYMFFSVYIYAHTELLNERFKGNNNALQGVHDSDLISFARWKKGELDVFYFINSGNVVFDALKDTDVSPVWEFD